MRARRKVAKVSELIVTGFKDPYRASEVLNELRRREWDWVSDLDQAVVVRRDSASKLRILISVDPATNEGVAWARLWGSFLSLALFVPVMDSIVGVVGDVSLTTRAPASGSGGTRNVLADVKWWKEYLRIPDEFVRDIGALIQPGDSALFMLLRTAGPRTVLPQFRDHGGILLHYSLAPEQDDKLRNVLALK